MGVFIESVWVAPLCFLSMKNGGENGSMMRRQGMGLGVSWRAPILCLVRVPDVVSGRSFEVVCDEVVVLSPGAACVDSQNSLTYAVSLS